MSEETVYHILNPKEKTKNSSGIGIKNVNDKIKLYFGEAYGLSVNSELGSGTTITIRLPYVPKQTAENMSVSL